MKTVYIGGEGEIVEKKSRFIATVRPVASEEEAVAFIAEMKKKYWDARHNCSAFVIGDRQELSRCSDDGEPAQTAGRPMLDVLLREEIHNAAVVVTRYFGGVLLGTVHATKFNGENRYVGTDLGFNVLVRPAMYDSFHDIEIFRDGGEPDTDLVEQSIVGNICESGDILAKKRMLPRIKEGDIVAALDAGAYGFVMSSSYNQRPLAAEVLITSDGTPKLIRRRETLDDLTRCLVEE